MGLKNIIKKSVVGGLTGLLMSSCVPKDNNNSNTSNYNKPNVIVIIPDDLGWADVGYNGSPIETPNIDKLAEEGVRFNNFVVHPWCSPTRAEFYTGHFPGSWAYRTPNFNGMEGTGIPEGEYTIAERFRDAGYSTALIGKWHMGTQPEFHPNEHGFDYFYGHLGGYIGFYIKKAIDGNHDWWKNKEEIYNSRYATNLLGEEASRYIRERDKSKPFFMTLAFNAPHFPQQAPEDVIEKYRNSTFCRFFSNRCGYMAQVDVMDQEIGLVLDTLDDEGIRENTLTMFFSDNGGSNAFGGYNSPFPGEKGEILKGGVQVAAFANWPGVINSGIISDQRIHTSDLFATLEAAVGLRIRAPAHESTNMWPQFNGGARISRNPALLENLASDTAREFYDSGNTSRLWRGVLTDNWRLTISNYEGVCNINLFDVNDPLERDNMSLVHPEVVDELIDELQKLEKGLKNDISHWNKKNGVCLEN